MKRIITTLMLLMVLPLTHAQTNYINEIPDFTQTDVKGKRTGNGQQYCAPAAVSNSLMWLSERSTGQRQLVEQLASSGYMNTDIKQGTGTSGVLRGVDKMAKELFGGYDKLEYQGWRLHPKKFSTGVKTPKMDWLAQGVSEKSAVWLNIGWYQYDKTKNLYKRIGGHWVTLVGIQKNKLVLHDPSPRAGSTFSNEFVVTRTLVSGTLTGKKTGLPVPAKGYLSLTQGMHIKSRADTAIVDGAVVFRVL